MDARGRTMTDVRACAIFLADASGIVTGWTSGAEHVMGYTTEEVMGRSVAMFYLPEDVARGEVDQDISQTARIGKVERETWRVRKGGARFRVSEIATSIPHPDGPSLGFVTISRALRKRKRLQRHSDPLLEAVLSSKRQADDNSRLKDQFLSILGHELRTPLAPILLWARGLHSGAIPMSELPRAVDAIVQSAETQARMIEDLLDLSRLLWDKLQLDRQRTPVLELAQALVKTIGGVAEKKGIVLQTDLTNAHGDAMLDGGRIRQVLWHLLSNAVKFTPTGGRICLRVGKDGDQLTIQVADSGQGIEPDILAKLFAPFEQAASGESRPPGELGIGLALCRSLIELHGGTLEACSAGTGRGAAFTAHIPWITAMSAQRDTRAPPTSSRALSLRGRTLLLVEDDTDTREAMRWTLEHAGAHVVAAANGPAALALLTSAQPADRVPEIMLCDISLPGMSGYQLIASVIELRRARHEKPIAACAVSAHARHEDQLRAIDAGFDSYLVKPVSAERLIEAAEELAAVAGEAEASVSEGLGTA